MASVKLFSHLPDINKQWEKLKYEAEYEVKAVQKNKLIEIYSQEEEKLKEKLIEQKSCLKKMREELKSIKKENISEEIENINKETESVVIYLESIKEKHQNLEKVYEEKKDKNSKMLAKLEDLQKLGKELIKHKNDIALYTHLTKIRWLYDSKPQEVKGLILQKKEIKPFSLDREKDSEFFIANYLWDQIKS